MKDIRQTPQYAKYLESSGWVAELKHGNYYYIKKLPMLGSIIKLQRPETTRYKDIEILRKKYRPFQIIVEPKFAVDAKMLVKWGYKPTSPYLPSKTLQIEISSSITKIQESMKKDARQALKKTENMGIIEVQDITEFRCLWKKAVGWKRHVPSYKNLKALKKSFGNNSLFIVTKNSVSATKSQRDNQYHGSNHSTEVGDAGGAFLVGDGVGYYWQAFTGKAGRRELAQYRIVWEGMLWARGRGAKIFDFEGIYDKRFPNKSWKGFTHFKKSFGGYEVEYPGCFVKNRFTI